MKKIIEQIGTPFFVYNQQILNKNIDRIFEAAKQFGLEDRIFLFISYFANSNPNIVKKMINSKIGILLQAPEEYFHLKKFGVDSNMMVSPSFLSNQEIDFWTEKNIAVNLASIEEVQYWISTYNSPMSFRMDLTVWQNQRIGIKKEQLKQLAELFKKVKITPKSIQVYCGTGSDINKIKKYVNKTIKTYKKYFSAVKELNLGGGFNFNYDTTDVEAKHFDWTSYFSLLKQLTKKYDIPSDVKFILEPGRDVFADIGQLVIQIKRIVKFPRSIEVSTNGSFVYLPSAKQKNRNHNLIFFDKNFKQIEGSQTFSGKLSGSTTLSSDYVLPHCVKIPKNIQEGDFIAIQDTGAYGATQHLEFLNKKPCPELMVDDEKIILITERGSDTDRVRYILEKPIQIT